ncbi:uroporphyrinogen decarboxylase family protein [bacterium]|nr:uroporphyrinogen decarboxylase family protein [bacterium]
MTRALLAGQPLDRLLAMPILMMYSAEMERESYADYVRDFRVLVRCQLRLVEEFGIDCVSCCSDPVRETADCGAELEYYDNAPPRARKLVLADRSALGGLQRPDPLGGGRMTDRVKACALFREQVGGEVPILGWVEGPMAEAVDLRGMSQLMMDLYDDPAWVEEVFDWVTEMEIAFARAQIEAGADFIGVGDAAASLVSAKIYRSLILPREQRIVAAIREAGAFTRLHICGNTTHLLPYLAETGAEIVELDHPCDITHARELLGPRTILMGNFHPVSELYSATPEVVRRACERSHRVLGDPYILAAGCEVPPGTPRANLEAMFGMRSGG